MSEIVRTRVVVEGRVQRVYFRESTRQEATRLGLAGWVRNLKDGNVEAVFEGPAQAVASAVEWTRHGPAHAIVTSLSQTAEQPEGLTEFEIRST